MRLKEIRINFLTIGWASVWFIVGWAITWFIVVYLGVSLITVAGARAQDTFVPTGLKSSCEYIYGTECARVGRPRTRIVRVPVTRYKAMRHVPEHLAPITRREHDGRRWREVRPYQPRRIFPRCWPAEYKGYSGQHVIANAQTEAKTRWAAIITAELGERYATWERAEDQSIVCFATEFGERTGDKWTPGQHQRCIATARPCRIEQ